MWVIYIQILLKIIRDCFHPTGQTASGISLPEIETPGSMKRNKGTCREEMLVKLFFIDYSIG